jgi:hypothetical protein
MAAKDSEPNPADEYPECKLKPSAKLAEAVRAIRQDALDQFVEAIFDRILHRVKNDPYLTVVDITRDQLIAPGRPRAFIPHTLHPPIRDSLLKYFKDQGIGMTVDGVGANWSLHLTLKMV